MELNPSQIFTPNRMRNLVILLLILNTFFSFGQKTAQEYLKKSEEFYKNKKYDSAYTTAKKTLQFLQPTKKDSLFVEANLQLLYAVSKVEPESQNEIYSTAKKTATNLKNWKLLAKTHYTLARIYYNQRNYEDAQPLFLKVDSIAAKYGFMDEVVIKSILDRAEISRITFTYEGVEKASDLQDEALVLAKQINSEELIHDIYLRLADMHGLKGNYPESKKYIELAYNYYIKQDNVERMAWTYLNYMNYYYAVNENDKAGEKLEEGIAYLQDKNEPHLLARMTSAYGTFFRKRKKDYKKAIPPYLAAEKMYRDLNDTVNDGFLYLMEGLALCYAQEKDFENAYKHYQQTYETKKAIVKNANNELTRSLETEYQTEKKEQEIAVLSAKNELANSQKRNQQIIMFSGLGLTTLLGLFFFFQFKNHQKVSNKLKDIDSAKSSFFANITHEFRTPLTLIKGPLEEQLISENITPSQRKNLIIAKKNTSRLENLIDQLLSLSKLESGNFKLNVQLGNLSKFIAAQAEAFSFVAKEQQLNYIITLKNQEAEMWFDPSVLERILFNLIGNAVKYTPEKGTIEITGEVKDGNYILSVSNTGTYLSEEHQNEIFNRFYQVKDENPGTGIGLSLTKELVALHKGFIKVDSIKDGNTTFTINISVNKNSFAENEIVLEKLQSSETLNTPINEDLDISTLIEPSDAPILLIVDDNKEMREFITSLFETTHIIHTAKDGNEGLEKAKEIVPDVVISDVMMPGTDGFTFTANLKENEFTSHIPVVLLTAKVEDRDKLQGLQLGADAYITKPFKSEILRATLKNLLESRRKLQERFSQEVILTAKDIAVTSADERFLERLQIVLDENITNPEFSTKEFAQQMTSSRMQLYRKLKALTGQSTSEFLRTQRLKLASTLLKGGKISVSETGYAVGFNDASYFTKCFKEQYGKTPSDYILL